MVLKTMFTNQKKILQTFIYFGIKVVVLPSK